MGFALLDLKFRLERVFGIGLAPEEFRKLFERNEPRGVIAGPLFDFVWSRARRAGGTAIDDEMDAEAMWPMFQWEISNALGVDPEDVTKESRLVRDFGGY